MNSDRMEDIMLHAYLGIAASLPDDITNAQIEFEMKDGQTKLKVTDGATGYTQEHQTRTKKLDGKLDKLERAAREERMAEELESSDSPAGKALVDKVT